MMEFLEFGAVHGNHEESRRILMEFPHHFSHPGGVLRVPLGASRIAEKTGTPAVYLEVPRI